MAKVGALRLLVVLTLALAHSAAYGATHVYSLTIGNNRQPQHYPESSRGVATLRYADDDSAAFHELLSTVARKSYLLTVMDSETQQLYPELVPIARTPQVAELRAAVVELRREIETDRQRGDTSVLYVFYSGHGSAGPSGSAALALLDFDIDRDFLYTQLLEQLRADYVHLLVDACHAEAVVRPRDGEVQHVSASSSEAQAVLVRSTLARFPRVGAIVAATSETESHEWDMIGHGVFTYELLSALRGAADVNNDGRIEYSEVSAFLSAANRSVQDPRGRLSVVARAPDVDRRAPLFVLRDSYTKHIRLTEIPAETAHVEISDEAGRKHATFLSEPKQLVDLVLPPRPLLFVRVGEREASLKSVSGGTIRFRELAFREARRRSRGSIDASFRSGLFASAFGRGYYMGFTDQAAGLVPVPFAPNANETIDSRYPAAAVANNGLGYSLELGVGLTSSTESAAIRSAAVRIGIAPRRESGFVLAVDGSRSNASASDEWRARASAAYIWPLNSGVVQAWLGPVLSGGVFVRESESQTSSSGALGAGSVLRLTAALSRSAGLWSQAEISGIGFRRDDSYAFMLAPSVFGGARFLWK